MFHQTALTRVLNSPMNRPVLFPLRYSGYIIASS